MFGENKKLKPKRSFTEVIGRAADALFDIIGAGDNVFAFYMIGSVLIGWFMLVGRIWKSHTLVIEDVVVELPFKILLLIGLTYLIAILVSFWKLKRIKDSMDYDFKWGDKLRFIAVFLPIPISIIVCIPVILLNESAWIEKVFFFPLGIVILSIAGGAAVFVFVHWGLATTLGSIVVAYHAYTLTGQIEISAFLEILAGFAIPDEVAILIMFVSLGLSHADSIVNLLSMLLKPSVR